MRNGKRNFIAGFATGALLCGSVAVFAGVYVTSEDGDWIRNPANYSDATDQINVLGDIAPGGGVIMQEIGLRLNAMAAAGKKQNWGYAEYEAKEMEEAMAKLSITRPGMAAPLQAFIDTNLAPVNDAITAADKTAFKDALGNMANACTGCHIAQAAAHGEPAIAALVVKIGKSALPIQ